MDNANEMKKTSWWQSHRPSTRRLVQLYTALLYNAQVKGFVDGQIYQGKAKMVCLPGFNCYSCPGAVGACPLGSIQNALASSGHRAGWYVLGIILLYGVILGRTICGWLCPLGLIQELLHKIPTPKIRKSRVTRALSWMKYVILAVFAIAIPLWYGLAHGMTVPGFCKYICPAGTFEGAMGLLPSNPSFLGMLGILFTRKFVIMLVIGLACIFCYRSFCRFICPLGAIYGLFNRFNIIGVKVDTSRCNHCGACVRGCGMDVRRVGDHECINCGKCMESCKQGAISIKAGKITLKAPEMGCAGDAPDAPEKRKKIGRIVWAVALAVLCFAVLWFNVLDPSIQKGEAEAAASASAVTDAPAATETPAETVKAEGEETQAPAETVKAEAAATEAPTEVPAEKTEEPAAESWESSAPVGYAVGQLLQDFTVKCYDGSTFRLSEQRGKVVVINLWATWCGPCVAELPHFEDLAQQHGDDLVILALRSSLPSQDDPVKFVEEKGFTFHFADDADGSLYKIVNGGFTLPQTIVLNRRGEVIYNEVRSVTPEMLASLYEQADKSESKAARNGGTVENTAGRTDTADSTEAPAETMKAEAEETQAPAETSTAEPAAEKTEELAAAGSWESSAPVGYAVGQQLQDFTVKCYDGTTFRLSEKRGKVVVINLWATWCGACVAELPYFEDLAKQHGDDVAVLALHSSVKTQDDPVKFVEDKGFTFLFGDDADGSLYKIVNGGFTLPQTIVLNRRGEVIFNEVRSVTPEMLASLYEQAGK